MVSLTLTKKVNIHDDFLIDDGNGYQLISNKILFYKSCRCKIFNFTKLFIVFSIEFWYLYQLNGSLFLLSYIKCLMKLSFKAMRKRVWKYLEKWFQKTWCLDDNILTSFVCTTPKGLTNVQTSYKNSLDGHFTFILTLHALEGFLSCF